MDAIITAIDALLTAQHFFYLILGVIIGLVIAILPGLGGTAGLSLVLPFIFGMDPISAVALMVGLLAVTSTGDTFPSVLMGIPGSNSSQATVVDGFPLAKKGRAAMALSAAFSASLIGGVIGAIVLTAGMFAARPLILGTGLGEQLLLVILALTMVGMLTGRSISKGLAACGIGLMIGSIGAAPATGELRYSFSTVYLSDGIPLVVLALGIFAVPEIVDLLRSRSSISKSATLGSGWREGLAATIANKWLVLRCSGIGCLIGALPGLGGSVIDWMAYGHAVQTARDKSQFGQGDIRGVIAPESANNAKEGGALFPTLFFGIPGSASTALLLGGFIMVGIQPGVSMVTSNIHLTYVIIWSLAAANIIATLICILIAPGVARLTTINYSFLGPPIIVLIVFTAYQATVSWGDIWTLAVVSLAGILMKRFDWPRPALVIGFVLSTGLEAAIYRTTQIWGFSFLWRPQSQLLVALILLSLFLGWRGMRRGSRVMASVNAPMRSRLPQLAFTAALLAIIAYALVDAMDMRYLSRLFPASVAVITGALLVVVLLEQTFRATAHPVLADMEQRQAAEDADGTRRPGVTYYLAWFAGLLGLIHLLGYPLGAAAFIVAFLTRETRGHLFRNLAIGAFVVLLLGLLSGWLLLSYPPGLLGRYMNLPWWLG